MTNNDWTRFVKRITINTPIPQVYKAWATPAGLESWFLRNAWFASEGDRNRDKNEFIEKNDTYVWSWFGHPETSTETNNVIDANGRDFFQFGFAGDCIVTIQLNEKEGVTIVELTQENIPLDDKSRADIYVGCGEGWTFYLANLKSVLEGGIDLRNKNENIKRVVNS